MKYLSALEYSGYGFGVVVIANICAGSNKPDVLAALHFHVVCSDQSDYTFCAIKLQLLSISTDRSTKQINFQSNSAVTGTCCKFWNCEQLNEVVRARNPFHSTQVKCGRYISHIIVLVSCLFLIFRDQCTLKGEDEL